MRLSVSCLLAAVLFAQGASAQALAPGRPAGVRGAQRHGPNLYLVMTVGTLAVAGGAVLMSQGASALATKAITGGEQATVPIVVVNATTSSTN